MLFIFKFSCQGSRKARSTAVGPPVLRSFSQDPIDLDCSHFLKGGCQCNSIVATWMKKQKKYTEYSSDHFTHRNHRKPQSCCIEPNRRKWPSHRVTPPLWSSSNTGDDDRLILPPDQRHWCLLCLFFYSGLRVDGTIPKRWFIWTPI